MSTNIVMTDLKSDGAAVITCDIKLEDLNLVLTFENFGMELTIPIDVIGAVLNDDLHG